MKNFLFCVLSFIAFSHPAYAYLDGGTGSIIAQLLLGGAAGAMVLVKLYWQRFKSFFQRKEPAPEDTPKD